jgi:hypothetical protein
VKVSTTYGLLKGSLAYPAGYTIGRETACTDSFDVICKARWLVFCVLLGHIEKLISYVKFVVGR